MERPIKEWYYDIGMKKEKTDYAALVHAALKLDGSPEEYDVIQFQHNSRNVPVGSGSGERLARGSSSQKYDSFVRMNGRQVLSNMHPTRVDVDGKLYPSPEHAFHAGKALMSGDTETAAKFEVDGAYGDIKPKDVKQYGGKKHLKMSPEALNQWNQGGSTEWMQRVLKARFEQDKTFRKALEASGKALLVHQIRGNTIETKRLSAILHGLRSSRFQ